MLLWIKHHMFLPVGCAPERCVPDKNQIYSGLSFQSPSLPTGREGGEESTSDSFSFYKSGQIRLGSH